MGGLGGLQRPEWRIQDWLLHYLAVKKILLPGENIWVVGFGKSLFQLVKLQRCESCPITEKYKMLSSLPQLVFQIFLKKIMLKN